ncbi:MAG: hypothetical protein OXH52_04085 [Gammaproteobacteria bacterium]|nr:hypothetical protein [Gammaproteobacteria bacterium]
MSSLFGPPVVVDCAVIPFGAIEAAALAFVVASACVAAGTGLGAVGNLCSWSSLHAAAPNVAAIAVIATVSVHPRFILDLLSCHRLAPVGMTDAGRQRRSVIRAPPGCLSGGPQPWPISGSCTTLPWS